MTGKIARITNFGAFVELLPGKDGLLRTEEMGEMEGEPQMGQEITVMVQEIDSMGRVNLSRRALFGGNGEAPSGAAPRPQQSRPPFPDRDRGRPRPGRVRLRAQGAASPGEREASAPHASAWRERESVLSIKPYFDAHIFRRNTVHGHCRPVYPRT